jgi:nucleoside-diphosphate-sugar epimerase
VSRILITGATGFVGGAVIRALRANGHSLSGTTRQADLAQGEGGVPLYRVPDFSEAMDWTRIVAGADVVVHLAARAHMTDESGRDALELYRATNRDGSRHLAEAAVAAGVKRFVFMSSVKAVAEESHDRALTEADTPRPEDAYGISKWEAEQELRELAARTGLELVILRPPLVYGPEARGNLLTLLKACDRGWPLPLGGVDNRRSLVSLANLASAVGVSAFDARANGQTFFVSDGEDISTAELVRRLAYAMGRKSHLIWIPPPVLSIAKRLPKIGSKFRRLAGSLQIDSRAIRDRLGWTPPQRLDDGLTEMATWYRASRASG